MAYYYHKLVPTTHTLSEMRNYLNYLLKSERSENICRYKVIRYHDRADYGADNPEKTWQPVYVNGRIILRNS